MSVADAADMIVNGCEFTRDSKGFHVLNLNQPDKAAVFTIWANDLTTER